MAVSWNQDVFSNDPAEAAAQQWNHEPERELVYLQLWAGSYAQEQEATEDRMTIAP